MTDRQLMSAAKEASLNAYIPYSHFAVGAALECENSARNCLQAPQGVHQFWLSA